MSQFKLSLIIPMYNVEKYIERCLNSILDQNIKQSYFEIILINDGSTDNSLSIAKKYNSKFQNLTTYTTKNQGLSSARNLGIQLAKGIYIYFIDSDDCIIKNSLKLLIETAIKYDLDILGFKASRVKDLNLLNNLNNEFHPSKELFVSTGKNYLSDSKYYKEGVWWYFIKKQYIKNFGLTFYDGKLMEDMVFTIKLFINANKVSFIPMNVYLYMINPNSIWTNRNSSHYRKTISDFIFMTFKFNELIINQEDKQLINRLNILQNNMVLNILKRMLRSDISYKDMNEILNSFVKKNLFPLSLPKLTNLKHIKFYVFSILLKNKLIFFITTFVYQIIKLPTKKL